MSNHFTIKDKEIHSLFKLIGVAFHSINNGTSPTTINFTTNEIEQMFRLHEDMLRYFEDQERQAELKTITENT